MNQIDLAESLRKAVLADPEMGPRFREIEEIEKEAAAAVKFVDLDVAFSPILLGPSTTTEDAVAVGYRADGGKFVIREPFKVVKESDLKLMRARYLIVNGREQTRRCPMLRKMKESNP